MTKLTSHSINPKDYWSVMKSLMGSKVKPGMGTLNDNGNYLVSPVDKANAFNRYFAEQSTLDQVPRALPPLYFQTSERLDCVRTNPEEVEVLIRTLDSTKANGPDEISIHLLKQTSTTVSGALSRLFNNSFEMGTVPLQWKLANITPVYKKGDRQLVNNYRPISLLSVVGKLQEKIVFKALYTFLSRFNLLTWRNSGFKPLDSAMHQLVLVNHTIYEALDKGHVVNIAFLDISKAFDRVCHLALTHKLKLWVYQVN
jgi:hypothetical protein